MNAASDTALPEPHQEHVNQVLSTVAALHTRRPSLAMRDTSAMPGAGGNAVIAICGERGAGKTTILEQVCKQLNQSSDVVLPTIRPEFFSSNDSVLGLALAHLRRMLELKHPEVLHKNVYDETSVGVFLNRMLRRASIIGDRDHYDERRRGQSIEEIADDFVRSASVGSSFASQWCQLATFIVDELEQGAGKANGRSPALIISVDDADLAPELLTRILVDLRVATAAPQVICLLCIDLSEARRALSEHYLRNYASLAMAEGGLSANGGSVHSVVESQLSKAVPAQWRTTIRELTVRERLEFVPLETNDAIPLRSLLAQFPLAAGGAPQERLDRLFIIPDTDSTSPYAFCLPSSPRELETVYFQLRNAARGDSKRASSEAARIIVERGLEFGLRNSFGFTANPSDLVLFDVSAGTDAIRLIMNNVSFYGDYNGQRVVLHAERMVEGFEVTVGTLERTSAAFTKNTDDIKLAPKMHRAAVNSLLLAREFFYAYSVLHDESPSNGPVRGGARQSLALGLAEGRDSTDQRYLLHPPWETYYDYFLVDEGWRRVLDVVKRHVSDLVNHRTAVAAVALEWWRLHASVQATRRLPKTIGDIVMNVSGESAAENLRIAVDETWALLSDVYERELRRDETRARDFVQWIETYLLFVCHSDLLDEWFIDETIDRREALLTRHRRLTIGNAKFVTAMSSRLRRVAEEPWIEPLIDLLGRFDEQAAAELGRLHAAVSEERERNLVSQVGALSIGLEPAGRLGAVSSQQKLYAAVMTALDDLERDARLAGRG